MEILWNHISYRVVIMGFNAVKGTYASIVILPKYNGNSKVKWHVSWGV